MKKQSNYGVAVRNALREIAKANKGVLNPEAVVRAARLQSSPLHKYFEWDDRKAAHSNRLDKARHIIRKVHLKTIRPAKGPDKAKIVYVREYQSLQSNRGKEGGYETTASIITDKDKRQELIDRILKELKSYRERYEDLMELQGIWKEIDTLILEQKRKDLKAVS